VARPVITADTPAIREALTHGEHAWLCPAGDPDGLASAITTLKADAALRSSLAHQGHQLFLRRFSLAALTNDISAVMLEALRR
jgi:glycosyltransferase involved in cell wall biosynthesis